MQGIKARYARRQASSAKAGEVGRLMGPQAELAWEFVREVQAKNAEAKVQGRSQDERSAEGKGYMIVRPGRSPDERDAEGKGYMIARPGRSPDERDAEGKGYMVGRPEKS